jgi:multiple sugar transport system substrate-binding protein
VKRLVAAVLLVVAMAAGCRWAESSAWPKDAAPRTITILSGTDVSAGAGGNQQGVYQRLADWWNKNSALNGGYTIRFEYVPGGATAVHSQMIADAQTHAHGGPDIYNLDSEWISEFARGGYLRRLDGKVGQGDFLPAPWAAGQDSHGDLFGVPFVTDVGLLYYRTDLVQKSQITALHGFADLMALAARTAPKGGEGYAGQYARYEGLTVNALDAVWSRDPAAFNTDGTVHDRAAVAAGLRDLVAAVRRDPAVIPARELDFDESAAVADFAAGKAALMRNWPIYYGQLKNAKPINGVDIARTMAIAPLPFVSPLGGQDLAISQSSDVPHAALRVIQFLTQPESQRCLFVGGGFAATRAKAYGWPSGQLLPADGRCGTAPLLRGEVLSALESTVPGLLRYDKAKPRPATRYYTQYSEVLQDGVRCLLTPHQGCDDENTAISALIDRLDAAARGRVR